VDKQLVGCENFVEERKGENVREPTRQRGDEEIHIESGEHSRQARRGAGRRMSWEREPSVTRAEGLVGCGAGRVATL